MQNSYLIAYNIFLCLAWALFFVYSLVNGMQMDEVGLLLLNIAQFNAIFEIVHVAMGLVRSPLLTTTVQVFSRIFVLLWINIIPLEGQMQIAGISGLHMIIIAWSITEIVRYAYYATQLMDMKVKVLTFLRYTLFIVLYPIGVTGEWLILLSVMRHYEWSLSIINIFLGIVLLSYFYFFPKLYLYMFSQRRKKLV